MDKPLPQNKQAESALIAHIFLKNDILADCVGILKTTDFYFKPNEIIYSKALELYKKNVPIDAITFTNSIDKDLLKGIGGMTYLCQIIGSEINANNYKSYIKIIKDLSIKRDLIKACMETLDNAYKDDLESKVIIDSLGSKLVATGNIEENKTVGTMELMEGTLNLIEDGFKNGGKLRGITTGYKGIDNATNGFMKGDLMIIAARPSMGKTALVMNMLNNIPKEYKTLMFEMEMSQEKLGVRMLAPKILMGSRNLSRGQVKADDFKLIMVGADEISKKDNVFINCKVGLSTTEIRAEAKKIKIQKGLDIIFLDHIGKIRPNNLNSSRNDQIGQISEDLKNMAKDLDCCVVTLSQLSRAVEARLDKRPMLSDLRDSGNIEQDADQILMLYREDYYAERENRQSNSPGLMEVLVAKNRDGEVGMIKLHYNTDYQIITEQYLNRR